MARRKPAREHVRVLVSFNGMRAGDEAEIELTPRVHGWIDAGLMEVLSGPYSFGPGSAEPDDHERLEDGAAGSVPPGGESGEGFGAGAYGSAP